MSDIRTNTPAQPQQPNYAGQKQPSLKQLFAQTFSDGKKLLTAQVNLTTTELQQSGKTIGAVSVMALIAVSLVSLGSIFLLIALAYVLVALGLPVWSGFLIVAGVLILGAAIFGGIAYKKGQKISGPSLASQEWKQTSESLAQLNERKPF
jgi:uncharacterized membrane protein YqjE